MGVFGLDLWCCPPSVGYLWCSWLGFGFGLLLGRVWFRGRPACPPPFPVPARGVGVCAGPGSRLCPVCLGWVVGVCFFFFLLWLFLFFFFFFWALWSLSLHPLSFELGWWLSFFFFFFCPFSPWSAVTGLVLPVLGGWFACASAGVPLFFFFSSSGGGAWPPVVVLAGGWAQDNRHSVPTHIPIPGPTLPVAGGGRGSNTTHALLSPDPETLPIGGLSRPATGGFLETKRLQGGRTFAAHAPSVAGPNFILSRREGPAIIP